MDMSLLLSPESWGQETEDYLHNVDEIPHHYHLHFMHGAQILGYKYPKKFIAMAWLGFYLRAVSDMHLYPESEKQMDARLNDFGRMQ
jgi:predicted phage-related endonuclease